MELQGGDGTDDNNDGATDRSSSNVESVTSEETPVNNKTNTAKAEFEAELSEGFDAFDRAQTELLSAVSAEASSSFEHSLATIARIPRPVLITEAWTGTSRRDLLGSLECNNPILPCISWAYGTESPPQLLKRTGIVREIALRPGAHAFVKMPGESSLRVGLIAVEFGAATGHPHLALEEPVEAAGEVEIDDEGRLVRWNNLSGTYKVSEQLAFQVSACVL
jgi:hypothetical protein